MTEFNQQEFLLTSTPRKIEMLNNATGRVHLENVSRVENGSKCGESDWMFWHSRYSIPFEVSHYSKDGIKALYLADFKMSGLCDDKPTEVHYGLDRLGSETELKTDAILEILDIYEQRGWVVDLDEFAYNVFRYNDPFRARDDKLYKWVISRSGVDLETLIKRLYTNIPSYVYGPLPSGIQLLFEKLLDSGHRELVNKYSAKQLQIIPDRAFFQFCLKHDLEYKSTMSDLKTLIPRLSHDECALVIQAYKDAGIYAPTSDFYAILIHILPDMVPDDAIDETVLDSVLFNGSLQLIRDRGLEFKDKTYVIRVPCPDCYNGEPYPCNYRYITANFVCTTRTGHALSELETCTQFTDRGWNTDAFWCAYGHFDGPADDTELYTCAGINGLGWDDEKDQRIYEIPPVKVTRSLDDPYEFPQVAGRIL